MGNETKLTLTAVEKHFGDAVAVDGVNLSVSEGSMVSLLGPSGCGKTTTLRMIAGLERLTGGEIAVDGRVIATADWDLEPEKRQLGMVFQSYALWPHMTVFDNVAYGLKLRRSRAEDIQERVSRALAMVNMTPYAERYVSDLSGGQQQRVALVRALATEPALVLFDEPLSNLDESLREAMRFEIKRIKDELGMTSVYVTHNQDEALALSDQVAVMDRGQIQQIGPPLDVYMKPRTRFVASFIGLANLLRGKVVTRDRSNFTVRLPDGSLIAASAPESQLPEADDVTVMVRPGNISIGASESSRPGVNSFRGRVLDTVFTGSVVDYFVEVPGQEQPIRLQDSPPVSAAPGDEVILEWRAEHGIILED